MEFGKHLKIHKTKYNTYCLSETYINDKVNRSKLNTFKHYSEKLDNSISRARTNIFNIVKFNKFEYFFTQTINSNYDRTDLKLLISNINDVVRNLRKLYPEKSFYYLVIPEYHSDNKTFHVHGFLSKDFIVDSYINVHGFLELKHFDKIGWNSISKIRSYEACLKYSGAYITKDLCKQRKVGEKLFYCSQGLKRSNLVYECDLPCIAPIHYDFKNEFVFKTEINEDKYYNLVTKLDNLAVIHYD